VAKKVTDHGEKRLRKRLGLSKSSVDKAFGDALLKGRRHAEFKGRFRRYLDAQASVHHSAPIVHGHTIYWTSKDGVLITAYQVPAMYRKYL